MELKCFSLINGLKMPRVSTRLLQQKQASLLTALTQIVVAPPAHPVVHVVPSIPFFKFLSPTPSSSALFSNSSSSYRVQLQTTRYTTVTTTTTTTSRNMSTVPSAASPPTSPPAKRVKTTTATDDTPSISTTMAAAETTNNGTAVPTLAQEPPLLIKKLSDKAKLPTRGSAYAAGYDLYAAKETTIPARGKALVDTDIAIAVPAGTCTEFPPPTPPSNVLLSYFD